VFWYKSSLVTSDPYVEGSIKEYVDFISLTKELLGDTVSDFGIETTPDLLKKYFLYKHSLLDKISTNIDVE
jgi:hypothetical protein